MKLRKLLAIVLILVLVIPNLVFADGQPNNTDLDKTGRYNAIREDVFNRIKESREISTFEIDNIESDENVRVIVELEDQPAIYYSTQSNCQYTDLSIDKRNDIESNILQKQESVKVSILNNNIDMNYINSFAVTFNGFSGEVKYEDVELIKNISGVKDVYISTKYNRPDEEVIINSSNDMIGSDTTWESGYKGEGMVIAILDTGVDPYHRDMILSEETTPKYNEQNMNALIQEKQLPGKYFNEKVPYGHNYFDDNNEILDLGPFASEHGMHVAGIAAANGDPENDGVTGVAPEAQILAMKIFSNDPDPNNMFTYSDIYIKAIDDAIKLGADVINMSIGAACSFYQPNSPEDRAITNAVENGVVCSVSAGNAGNIGSDHYYNPFKENPEVGTVGSPGLVKDSISVASIDSTSIMVKYLTFENVISNALPINSVIVNEKAYNINYLNNNADAQEDLIANFNDQNPIYIKLDMDTIVNIKGEVISDISVLPEKVNYYDENGSLLECIVIGEGSTETKVVKVPMSIPSKSPNPADEIEGPIEYVYCGLGSEEEFYEVDVYGKVALIKRGTVKFVDKIMNAYYSGAKAVVIFNNNGDGLVNIPYPEDCSIPAVFVGNSFGEAMAGLENKVLTFTNNVIVAPDPSGGNMSDFSSWGTTPSLELKPEITAPGGNIYSTLQKDSYGMMSGTSMAAPHITGASALVMQYIKNDERFNDLTANERARFVKKLLMNTAEIVLDENGMPCSPRQQGAGLANVKAAIETPIYIVDRNTDEAKVELKAFEDTNFTLKLRAYNISNEELTYNVDVNVLANIIDDYDENTLLSREMNTTITGPKSINVPANGYKDFEITVDFAQDELLYKNMFIEGFIKLVDEKGKNVAINIPYMGFYGDWSEPLILDGMEMIDDKSYFNNSGMCAVVNLYPRVLQTYKYYVPALSPGTEDGRGMNTDRIIPLTSFLRNAREVECNILDENYNRIRTITREEFIPKDTFNSGYYMACSLNTDRIWDGTASNEIVPDGVYYYEIKSKVDYTDAQWQSKKIKLYVDTVAPVVKDLNYNTETGDLTWTATDETCIPYLFYIYAGDEFVDVVRYEGCKVDGEDDKYSYNIGQLPQDQKTILQVACLDYPFNFGLSEEYVVGTGDFGDKDSVPQIYLETPQAFESFNIENAPDNLVNFEGYIIRNGMPIESLTINGEEVELIRGDVPVKDYFGEVVDYVSGYYYGKILHLENGAHNIHIEAKYNNDKSASINRTIFVDTEKAQMTAEVLERDPNSDTAKIKVTMKDNMPQLMLYLFDSLEFLYDGADEYTNLMPVEKEIVLDVKLKDGDNVFQLKLVDLVGNETFETVKITKGTN